MATLQASDLTLAYDKVTIVDELSLDIPTGQVSIVVGANGCGKSTLLRALSRLLKPAGGQVLLDGADIHSRPAKEVAKTLGLLPQSPTAPDGITARELISRGRYPHQGLFKRFSAEDEAAVNRAMELTGTTELAERSVDELSGGQRQRAYVAMVLAQDTDTVLLDEPLNNLDMKHSVVMMQHLQRAARELNRTIVIVLHDINFAGHYADYICAMKKGKVVEFGTPEEIMCDEVLTKVFETPVNVIPGPNGPLAVYY